MDRLLPSPKLSQGTRMVWGPYLQVRGQQFVPPYDGSTGP
jgi:hypothetical protein